MLYCDTRAPGRRISGIHLTREASYPEARAKNLRPSPRCSVQQFAAALSIMEQHRFVIRFPEKTDTRMLLRVRVRAIYFWRVKPDRVFAIYVIVFAGIYFVRCTTIHTFVDRGDPFLLPTFHVKGGQMGDLLRSFRDDTITPNPTRKGTLENPTDRLFYATTLREVLGMWKNPNDAY